MRIILKHIFKTFLKKLPFFFLLQIIFIILNLIFFLFSRGRLNLIQVEIQSLAPFLESITPENLDLAQLSGVTDQLESLIFKFNLYLFFIIPLVMLILFVIFQGSSFRYLYTEKFKQLLDWKFYLKFLLLTLPFFIIFTYLLLVILPALPDIFLTSLTQADMASYIPLLRKGILAAIFLILIGYFTFVSIALLSKRTNIVKNLQETFKLGIKKFYKFIPLYILFAIMVLALINSLFLMFISVLSFVFGSLFWFGAILAIIAVVLLALLGLIAINLVKD